MLNYLKKIVINNRLKHLYRIASTNLGDDFYLELIKISNELGMKPEDIIIIMISESGMNPSATNAIGGATGLVQFMPSTLKNLGFEQGISEFKKLTGTQQLPYVKKLIEANYKLLGKPFTSAALFYVGNFFPVALKLPGIRKEDPNCAFIEENPETVVVDGKTYSKKYYDVGQKISPQQEISAYKANFLFHGTTPNAITYADMLKQVEKIKSGTLYKKAIEELNKLNKVDKVTNKEPINQDPINVLDNILKLI